MAVKVLVSACLLGERVRHDGGSRPAAHPALARWAAEGRVVPLCPEVAGGLGVPRPAAERGPDGRVRRADGQDVTPAFEVGAAAAVALAQAEGCPLAVLKARSPSCGVGTVYDGTFRGILTGGDGLAAAALRAAGVALFTEETLDEAEAWLARRDAGETPHRDGPRQAQ
jgi:uncharacterized protein YbbK (DUF523 family)